MLYPRFQYIRNLLENEDVQTVIADINFNWLNVENELSAALH